MNIVIKSTLLFSILTSMGMAESTYWGGGISSEDYDSLEDKGIGAELMVGKIFSNNFGLEGRVNKTFTSPKETRRGIKAETESMAISLFATYSQVLSPEFTIMPKIGFTQFSSDAKISDGSGDKLKLDDSSTELSYGIDLKYKINMNTNAYLSYTIFKPKLDKSNGIVWFDEDNKPKYFSIGVQQKF